jgi:hypothetical protein
LNEVGGAVSGDVVDMNLDSCVSRLGGRVTPVGLCGEGKAERGAVDAGEESEGWRRTRSASTQLAASRAAHGPGRARQPRRGEARRGGRSYWARLPQRWQRI